MKSLKSMFLKNVPLVILSIYMIKMLVLQSTTVADSLIVMSLGALAGFKYYMNHLKQPNYVEMFQKQVQDIKKEQVEIKEIYKHSFENRNKVKNDSAWTF